MGEPRTLLVLRRVGIIAIRFSFADGAVLLLAGVFNTLLLRCSATSCSLFCLHPSNTEGPDTALLTVVLLVVLVIGFNDWLRYVLFFLGL